MPTNKAHFLPPIPSRNLSPPRPPTTNVYQYVQSFSHNENVTYEQAHAIGLEFAEKAWPGHEVQVATHCDVQHVHTHFVINSVSFETGMKLRQTPTTLNIYADVTRELKKEEFAGLDSYFQNAQISQPA